MGGAQYQVQLLIEELLKHGGQYNIHYITQRAAKNAKVPYQLHLLNGKIGKRFGQVFNFISLFFLLKKINPDTVYQRIAGGYTGLCAYYCKRHSKKMIFHIAHDLDVDLPEEKRRRKINAVDSWFKNYGISNSDIVIAQTTNQKALFKKYFHRNVDYQIYNFHFPPIEAPVLKVKKIYTIVWVANLKVMKRPELFIKLAAMFKDNSKFKFIMIGKLTGDNEYYQQMEAMISGAPSLTYMGERSIEQVNQQLSEADIFVNTSVFEGFSNSFIQSWMRGVPVYSLNANPDYIFDNHPCLGKCFQDNFAELAEAIRQYKGVNPDTYNQIKLIGQELFSIANAEKIISLF